MNSFQKLFIVFLCGFFTFILILGLISSPNPWEMRRTFIKKEVCVDNDQFVVSEAKVAISAFPGKRESFSILEKATGFSLLSMWTFKSVCYTFFNFSVWFFSVEHPWCWPICHPSLRFMFLTAQNVCPSTSLPNCPKTSLPKLPDSQPAQGLNWFIPNYLPTQKLACPFSYLPKGCFWSGPFECSPCSWPWSHRLSPCLSIWAQQTWPPQGNQRMAIWNLIDEKIFI